MLCRIRNCAVKQDINQITKAGVGDVVIIQAEHWGDKDRLPRSKPSGELMIFNRIDRCGTADAECRVDMF